MNPLISIIVPVHNVAAHLAKCLDSIIKQTFTHLEIIVVNDGSTDGSREICAAYAKRDPRIQIIQKAYGGVSSARNAGVAHAKGDYIGFVDGDDYIDEKMFETLYRLTALTNADIAICKLGRSVDGRLINETDDPVYTRVMGNEEAMRELFKGILYRFSLCNKLFKRSCFENITFPPGRIHEDLATTYRLFSKAKKLIYTNYLGYIYVKRPNSILTASYYEKRLDAFFAWDEILPFMVVHYPKLLVEVVNCYAYSCVDHFYYIVHQVADKHERKRYLARVQSSLREHYPIVQENANLPWRYQMIVKAIHYNAGLLLLWDRMKKGKTKHPIGGLGR